MAEGSSAPVVAPAGVRAAVVGVAVLVGALAAPIPTHTWASSAVTGAIGLVALAAVVVRRPRVGRTVPTRSVVPWVVVFAVVAALELGALAWGHRPDFPTLSWLLGPHFTEPAVRFGGYVVWICAGFWLVRR